MRTVLLLFLCGGTLFLSLAIAACGGETVGEENEDADDDDDDFGEASCTLEDTCTVMMDCESDYATVEECLTARNQAIDSCGDVWQAALGCHCACLDTETDCESRRVCGLDCWNAVCK